MIVELDSTKLDSVFTATIDLANFSVPVNDDDDEGNSHVHHHHSITSEE
jgi:hypothetical protein